VISRMAVATKSAPPRIAPRFDADGPSLKRKAEAVQHPVCGEASACACGGGCPRCAGASLMPKLAISEPGDPLEVEADRVAEAVLAPLSAGTARRSLSSGPPAMLQRQAAPSPTPAPTSPPSGPAPAAPPVTSPFDDLPRELQVVLEASVTEPAGAKGLGCEGLGAAACFERLSPGARASLRSIYNRFRERGLWSHVLRFDGVWTGGIDCRYFRVQGGVAGADVIVRDSKEFFKSLLANPRFCVDTPLGGMLHPGTTSVREVSSSDSLHLAIGGSNSVSVHVDAISPVGSRGTGALCNYDPTRAAAHIGREALPSLIPGLQVFPEQLPTPGEPGRETSPPTLIQWGIRF